MNRKLEQQFIDSSLNIMEKLLRTQLKKYNAVETVSNLQAAAGFSSISTILAKAKFEACQNRTNVSSKGSLEKYVNMHVQTDNQRAHAHV